MGKIQDYCKKADSFLQLHFKKYFLIRQLNIYKKKLRSDRNFDFKSIINYEKQWQALNRQYGKIYLYGIEFVSLGETVMRLFNLLEDMSSKGKRELYVVLPVFTKAYSGGIYNRRLFDVFGKKVYFVRESNIDLWTYIFYFHMKDIYSAQFDKYKEVRLDGIKVGFNEPLLPFTREETLEGEGKLRKMGIKGEFICIHARETNVKTVCFSKEAGHEAKCRACDINTFIKTSQYFYHTYNMPSVRLGKYETKKCNDEAIIDYANQYYDEFMDFYLSSRCKFLVSCDTGLALICGYWGRPVLMTNVVTICYGGESFPDTGYVMYLPKKFYSRKEKRYLNFSEMLDVMDECSIYTSKFVKKGIILEDNTEDEILEAAIEMNSRIENLWVETEEERKCYEKYWKIVHRWRAAHKTVKHKGNSIGYTMFLAKPSYHYLKSNSYLLEEKSL